MVEDAWLTRRIEEGWRGREEVWGLFVVLSLFLRKEGRGERRGGATGEGVLGGEKGEDELQPEQTDGK